MLAGQPQPDVVLRQQDVAIRVQTSGSWSRTQTSFGAVNPVSASLPVIAMSRSWPTASDLVAGVSRPLVVPQDRRPQDLVPRVEEHRAVHLPGQADRRDLRAFAGRHQDPADRLDRSVPPEAGSRCQQPGCGVSYSYSDAPTPATAPSSSIRTAFVAVVDASILRRRPDAARLSGRRTPRGRLVGRPDRLTRFSSSSWCPDTGRVDLPRRDLRLERRERLVAVEDRRPSGPLQRVAILDTIRQRPVLSSSAATSSARASVSIPPMWARNRSVRWVPGGAASRRS